MDKGKSFFFRLKLNLRLKVEHDKFLKLITSWHFMWLGQYIVIYVLYFDPSAPNIASKCLNKHTHSQISPIWNDNWHVIK